MPPARRTFLLGSAVALSGLALVILVVTRHRGAEPGTAPRSLQHCEQVDAHHWRIPRASRDDYFRSPGRLNQDIRLQPAMAADGNSLTELKIATLAPDGPMALAGFRPGDLIVSVNDKPVTTLARAVNLSQEVRASARLTVQVRREAKLIDFQFDFE